jgi:hypothetical protein
MKCPDCTSEIGAANRCACGWKPQRPTPDNQTDISPELTYLRNFYRRFSADPVCSECGAHYENGERGPFDAGHWMVNHWKQEHPSMYELHKARVEGKETTA